MFIAVDGIDGAGKTTLVAGLAAWLAPLDPLVTKEPTDRSEWGRRIRSTAASHRLPPEEELELFRRDRAFHSREVIGPALAAGRWVLTDRYVDSTLAFQAATPADADRLYEAMQGEFIVPGLTLILGCPVATGLARIRAGRAGVSAFENAEALERARAIYETRQAPHYRHLDGTGTAAETLAAAVAAIRDAVPGAALPPAP